MHFDLIVKGGEIVTSKGTEQVDILVKDGKIAKLGSSFEDSADETFNAKNLLIFPGLIDTQVHFREPGLTHKEDIESGSLAALYGGVTTFFEMPNTKPITSTLEALQWKIEKAKQVSHVDFAFFVGGTSENFKNLNELENIPGCAGVKIFMGSSTGDLMVKEDHVILEILKNSKKRLASHCEDEGILDSRKHIRDNAKSVHEHPVFRNEEAAMTATTRLINLARKTKHPVHILHVSTEQEMEYLKTQKDIATVEVTPQHLTFFAPDCYDKLGTLAQMNPPLRTKNHREALWKGIQNGTVDVIGSDHAPHTLEEKMSTYPKSPSGMPGVQTILPVMLNHVHQKNLSLKKFQDLCSTNHAKIYKIKHKGSIEIGMDADLAIVDFKKEWTIQNSQMKSKSGWTPYDGMKVKGKLFSTVLRGKILLREDELLVPPSGNFVVVG